MQQLSSYSALGALSPRESQLVPISLNKTLFPCVHCADHCISALYLNQQCILHTLLHTSNSAAWASHLVLLGDLLHLGDLQGLDQDKHMPHIAAGFRLQGFKF